jgi:hypothetical protein
MSERGFVLPYDPRWPSSLCPRTFVRRGRRRFAREGHRTRGSMAVPGLDAKPAVDLMVGYAIFKVPVVVFDSSKRSGTLTGRRIRIPNGCSSSGSLMLTLPRASITYTSWRREGTSGMTGSSSRITSASIPRWPVNTWALNTPQPNASATTARRIPEPKRTSSPQCRSGQELCERREEEQSVRKCETDISSRAILARCMIRSCNVPS